MPGHKKWLALKAKRDRGLCVVQGCNHKLKTSNHCRQHAAYYNDRCRKRYNSLVDPRPAISVLREALRLNEKYPSKFNICLDARILIKKALRDLRPKRTKG